MMELWVVDLDESVRWYIDNLGFSVWLPVPEEENLAGQRAASLMFHGFFLRLTSLPARSRSSPLWAALRDLYDPDIEPGVSTFSIVVADLDAEYKRLRGLGFPGRSRGVGWYEIQDPDGTTVRLVDAHYAGDDKWPGFASPNEWSSRRWQVESAMWLATCCVGAVASVVAVVCVLLRQRRPGLAFRVFSLLFAVLLLALSTQAVKLLTRSPVRAWRQATGLWTISLPWHAAAGEAGPGDVRRRGGAGQRVSAGLTARPPDRFTPSARRPGHWPRPSGPGWRR